MQVCVMCSRISLILFFPKSALWDSVRLLKEAVVNFSIIGKMVIAPPRSIRSICSVCSCSLGSVNSRAGFVPGGRRQV